MRPSVWNIILAVVWVALSGNFTAAGFLAGLLVGYLVLAVAGPAFGVHGYGLRAFRAIGFVLYYLYELVVSNLRVALDVIRPRMRSRPAFVAIPVDDLNPAQITLLANLITMTPGTLSIDVSRDESTLYIHGMFVDSPDALRRSIERGFKRRVREVLQ